MPSVGERLRQAREAQARPIDDIAVETRIPSRYLEAIEAGELGQLPGGFFARSFVRQYALALTIPMDELEGDLERWLNEAAPPETPNLKPRMIDASLPPVTEVMEGRRRPQRHVLGAVAALVLVIGVCAVVYSVWLQRQGELLPMGALSRESAPPAEQASTSTVSPAEPVETAAPEPGGAPAAETATQADAPETPASPPGAAQGPLWFEIAAREETWVRVRSGDETLFVGILQPGETRRFTGLETATMRVGNAGGLDLTVNGRATGAVGPRGHIRVVNLTPEQTDIAPPPRSSPAGGSPESNAGEDVSGGE